MQIDKLKNILEALLLASDRTLSVIQLDTLFELEQDRPTRDEIRKALHEMADDYQGRGYELKQVATGFRLQVRQEYAEWVSRLWEEKPARYTRALLETIALVAYRQPITRGEIEEVRGVSVSSNIIKTLMEREWIKVLGHKDVPGKPALYGTTREFLDYFNLKSLDQLPTLAEIKDLDDIHPELALNDDEQLPESVDGEDNPVTSTTTAPEEINTDEVVSSEGGDETEASEEVVETTASDDDLDESGSSEETESDSLDEVDSDELDSAGINSKEANHF